MHHSWPRCFALPSHATILATLNAPRPGGTDRGRPLSTSTASIRPRSTARATGRVQHRQIVNPRLFGEAPDEVRIGELRRFRRAGDPAAAASFRAVSATAVASMRPAVLRGDQPAAKSLTKRASGRSKDAADRDVGARLRARENVARRWTSPRRRLPPSAR